MNKSYFRFIKILTLNTYNHILFSKGINYSIFFTVSLYILLLSACQKASFINYSSEKFSPEQFPQQLQEIVISSYLPVYTWQPVHPDSSQTVRIYIEGDGRAWIKRGRPSLDPTPQLRLVHSLMLNDPKQDIAYIGRPCQYVRNEHCYSKHWTFDRYNQFSVDTINTAIDNIKEHGQYQGIELVGYSGGAAIALLTAASRNDIQSIRTVAGNLSPAYTNQIHQVSAMPDALDPASFSAKLEAIPQIHFYGFDDQVIPAGVSSHYIRKFNTKNCIITLGVEADHQKGWSEKWQTLLRKSPECINTNSAR